ncbi:hypothetical protein KDA_72660 [Dictyobacter alpinus]|uniref:Uncharacterized protein n=1 Tax=Dictyobacter alpinus TaxID=2014873 RepID=A0A402BKB6_9CHLR|nr:hypothetical protein [Dictyobacter alpinus]GCE31782.1 hypothetical protein KDA_72660 [Dictyobacter alpinus]
MSFSIGTRIAVSALCLACAGSFAAPATQIHADTIKNSSCQSWQLMSSPNPGMVNSSLGLAASAGNDVWMVGQQNGTTKDPHVAPLLEHWDGSKWSGMSVPATKAISVLFAVTTNSPQDAWAVGINADKNAPTSTLTEHWDGKQWRSVASPNVSGANANNFLYGVAASRANDVWAVGEANAKQSKSSALLEHWDGKQWSLVASPNVVQGANHLQNVTSLSPNDAWAVGSVNINNQSATPLIEHWDGKQWRLIDSPNVAGHVNALTGISASAPNDIWAVGTSIDPKSGDSRPLLEHWDGKQWSMLPDVGLVSDGGLQSVIALSPTNVWGAGSQINDQSKEVPLLEHWDGKQWSIVASPNSQADGSSLNTIIRIPGTARLIGSGTSYTKDTASTLVISTSCS